MSSLSFSEKFVEQNSFFRRNAGRWIVFSFFLCYLITGLFIFKDYGMAWDEYVQRRIGLVAWGSLFSSSSNLNYYMDVDKYYGVIFEVFLVLIEKLLKLNDLRNIYLMRHLCNFLFFYGGVFFFYLLCNHIFSNWKLCITGCLFLVLSPRIFAHSFYNSKDIPFLSMFIISIYTLVIFLDKKTLYTALLHTMTCAVLIDIRIVGIIIIFLTVVFLFIDYFIVKTVKVNIAPFLFITLLPLFIILFWPFLWKNPVFNFLTVFKAMSNFPWEGEVLYAGKYIKATEIPWHYIPQWIIITTPIFYIVSFLAGTLASLISFFKSPLNFYINKKFILLFILWFFVPLSAVIILKSVLYDAWRQMFFIYPAFILLALQGLSVSYDYIKNYFTEHRRKIIFAVFIFIIFLSMIDILYFMISCHPYQDLYFNIFAGRSMERIKYRFEMDYWGLSYREALEYIVENDNRSNIKLCISNYGGIVNFNILKEEDRKRLTVVGNSWEADYFLSNYRSHPWDYTYDYFDEIYSRKIGNAKIVVIYKINSNLNKGE